MSAQAKAAPKALTWRWRKLDQITGKRNYRPWFDGKQFSTDWTSSNYASWRYMLLPWKMEPLRILEIGSWEGRSALFFLNFFPQSKITCVDTFAGGLDHKVSTQFSQMLPQIEQHFDHNLAPFGGRVEKIKMDSAAALSKLAAEGRKFDLAYIDGGHRRDEVMADTLGTWKLLPPGGVIIWDDYTWGRKLPPEDRPKPAIDQFLAEQQGNYRLLGKSYQVAIERLK